MNAVSAFAEAAEDRAGRVLDCLYPNGLAIVIVIFSMLRARGAFHLPLGLGADIRQ
ncbi:MAG: hypothetical protein QM743_01915 [Chitinophagaceae bacterium]